MPSDSVTFPTDGPLRRILKAIARANFYLNRFAYRRLLGGPPAFTLTGGCRQTGQCCDAPAIRSNRLVWYSTLARSVFFAWQRHVNRFEWVETDRARRAFVFRCHHFNRHERRCENYATRPGICRDYPRNLLAGGVPEFFSNCGYRARASNADVLVRELKRRDVPPEVEARVRRDLHLD